MHKYIILMLSVILASSVFAKSPHGEGFKINCVVCHTTDNWTKIKTDGFDHNTTNFPLVGQHKTAYCRKCHEDLQFKNAKRECVSCHKDVHEQILGRNCERCHTPSSWIVNNIIQIHAQSRFPLIGKHAQVDCYQCHNSASRLRFDPMHSQCADCHLKDFNATTSPSHAASNFSKDCSLCHNEITWQSSTFNHNATSFPLTGGHFGVECIKCHANGYTSTSSACMSCHLSNFNATTNPNHITAKFSTDCQTCHSTATWVPSTFNHSTTSFPLTGAHIGVACTACHTNGYGAIPTTCVSCHLTNYNATTSPAHAAGKISTTCETCHTTTAWQPSNFNHNSTTFPLTGGHVGVDCAKCHTNGYAGGTPTTCVSCHLATYNATTNPNHAGANFPTACETCHSTTNWTSSTFNHSTYFPITSGNHNVSCATCHTNSANYAVFTCVISSCHGNAHHQDQGSAGCYRCHPNGRSGG